MSRLLRPVEILSRNVPHVKRGKPNKSYDHFTPTARRQTKRNCTPTHNTHLSDAVFQLYQTEPLTPIASHISHQMSDRTIPMFRICASVTGYRAISTLDFPVVA